MFIYFDYEIIHSCHIDLIIYIIYTYFTPRLFLQYLYIHKAWLHTQSTQLFYFFNLCFCNLVNILKIKRIIFQLIKQLILECGKQQIYTYILSKETISTIQDKSFAEEKFGKNLKISIWRIKFGENVKKLTIVF